MMPIHEKIKAPLLACALALLPFGAIAAGIGGGGHVGGGSFGAAATPPGTGLHPGPHVGGGLPTTTDVSSHARFVRPDPITGSRLPPMRVTPPQPQSSGPSLNVNNTNNKAGADGTSLDVKSHAPLHPFATPDNPSTPPAAGQGDPLPTPRPHEQTQ